VHIWIVIGNRKEMTMTNAMSAELYWLLWTAVLTGLLWVPYIAQIIVKIGLPAALSEIGGVEPSQDWSTRAKKAHANAVENLAVFAPLAIAVHVLDVGTTLTAAAAATYFGLRAAHFVVYTLGVPYLRTLLFLGASACQLILAYALLA
jgi:uncharacterized MAPEG superfamily protein